MSKNGGSLLHDYAEAGQVMQLEAELNRDLTKIDNKNIYGDTPLLWACAANQYDACVVLLQSGANIHEKNKFTGASALHKACEKGYFELCQLLISCGSNVVEKNKDGDGPLHVASEGGYVNIVLLLIENGGNVVDKGHYGNTPLHVACSRGNEDVALSLIAYGADIHEKDSDQHAPIHKAASEGHYSLLGKLVEYGADIHAKDKDEDTPLHLACVNGHTDIVLYLINNGCRIDERSIDGSMPLHLACRWGKSDIVNILINHSAPIHAENAEGSTPLHAALVDSISMEIAKQLIDCGANINAKNKSGVSPVELIEDEAVREELINYYNQVNNKISKKLFTDDIPVSETVAATVSKDDESTYLESINSTVDIHTVTKNGNILSLQTVLIHNPGRTSELNTNGENVLHVACRYGHVDIVQYLLTEVNINLVCKSKNGITPLHFASYKGHVAIVQLLVQYGVNIHEKDNGGSTPLHVACANNHEAVARYLILQGASISEPNSGGNSSMDLVRDSALRRDLIEYSNQVNATVVAVKVEEQAEDYLASMTATSAQIAAIKTEFISYFYETFIAEEVEIVALGCHNDLVNERNERRKAKKEKEEKKRLKEELSDIHMLAEKGKVTELMQELQVNPDRVNEVGAYGNTPIHRACRWGQRDIVKSLLDIPGININIKNNSGFLPIHYACDYGNKDILILLLCHSNIKLNEKSYSGETPLHRAVLKGNKDMVEILLMNQVRVNDRNSDGKTSLHIACYNDYKDIALLLIQHGAGVDFADNDGKTPLDLLRDAEVGKELLAFATETKRVNQVSVEQNIVTNSHTPFKNLIALIQGNKINEIEENMNQFVGVLNFKDVQGVTPLIYAVQSGNLHIVRLFVDNKADLEMSDEAGFAPLHYASARGEVEIVQLLLNKGVDSNVVGNIDGNTATAGDTPLHWSVFNNQIHVTKLLLTHRAFIDQRNNLGFTPLHHACSKPYIEMANLLLLNNAGINIRSEEGFTPLHLACRTDSKAIVLLLVDRGANKQERDEYGNTPLHHACMKGNKVIIKLLISLDVQVKEKNKNNKEPFDLIPTPEIRASLDEFCRNYYQEKLLMLNQGGGNSSGIHSNSSSGGGITDRSILAFHSLVNSPIHQGINELSRVVQSPIGDNSCFSPVTPTSRSLFQEDELICGEKLIIKGLIPFHTLSSQQKVSTGGNEQVISNGILKGYIQLPLTGEKRDVIVKEESYLLSTDIKIRDIMKEVEVYEYVHKLTKDNKEKEKYNGLVEMYGYSSNTVPRYLVLEYFGHEISYEFASSVEVRRILFNNLLLALQHLHSCGIVHGNLNPNNILVCRYNHYKVKLCDLGNARKEGEIFPSTDEIFTTSLSWSSPELYHGRPGVVKSTKSLDMFTVGLLGRILLADEEEAIYNQDSVIIHVDFLERAMRDQGFLNNLVEIPKNEFFSRLILSLIRLNPHERLNITDIISEIHAIPSKQKQLQDDMNIMQNLINKTENLLPRAIHTAVGTFASGVEKNLIVKINDIVRNKEEDVITRLLEMIEANEGPLLTRIATLINDENTAKLEQLNTLVLHNQSVINDKFSKYFMAEKDLLKEEIVELREEVTALLGKLSTAEARVSEKEGIITELTATVQRLHSERNELVVEHEAQKKQVAEAAVREQVDVNNEAIKVLSTILQETQNDNVKKGVEVRSLQDLTHQQSECVLELKEELVVVSSRYTQCKEDLDRYKIQKNEYEKIINELKESVRKQEMEFTTAKLKIQEDALQLDSKENSAMVRLMSENLKDLHAELVMKEEEIKTYVVRLTKLEAEISSKNEKISELGNQRADIWKEYNAKTNDAVIALHKALLDVQQQLQHVNEENHAMVSKTHKMEVELTSSNTRCTEYAAAIESYKEQLHYINEENHAMVSKTHQMEVELTSSNTRCADYAAKCTEYAAAIESYKEQLQHFNEEKHAMVSKAHQMEVELTSSNTRYTEYAAKCTEYAAAIESYKEQLQHFNEEKHSMVSKAHQMAVELTSSNTRCTEYAAAIESYKKQLQHVNEENHAMVSKTHQMEVELTSSNTRCADYAAAIESYKRQVQHVDEENHVMLAKSHQLEVELTSSNTRCTEYVAAIESYKKQVQELKILIEQNRIKYEGEKQLLLENVTNTNSENLLERVMEQINQANASLHRGTETKLSHLNSTIEQINATTVTLHRETENRLSQRLSNIVVSGIFHSNVKEFYAKYFFYLFMAIVGVLTYYLWSLNIFGDLSQRLFQGGTVTSGESGYDADDLGLNFDSIFMSNNAGNDGNTKFTFGRNNIKYI